jgi:lipopolysaccharide biosynthesis glycosyltransferase
MKQIHIASACDANYVPYLGVMMYSLLKNSKNPSNKYFHIIDGGINSIDRVRMIELAGTYGANIEFLSIDESKYRHLIVYSHWTHTVYYRLSLPELLENLDRVLYLDSDIICLRDIDEIYDMELDGKLIGAVQDMGNIDLSYLGVEDPQKCLNSGVLLMDMAAWRKQGVADDINEFITNKADKIRMPDQDILNAVLHTKWKDLGPRANMQLHQFSIWKRLFCDLPDTTIVLHFTSSNKPLNSFGTIYGSIFKKYLYESPWKEYAKQALTWRTKLKYLLKYIYFNFIPMWIRTAIRKYILNPIGFRPNMLSS